MIRSLTRLEALHLLRLLLGLLAVAAALRAGYVERRDQPPADSGTLAGPQSGTGARRTHQSGFVGPGGQGCPVC